ncbi:MAG TPA: hypothetical protein VKJ45_16230 [Blastocatellia bacterium]|nr:hypothetical protein [Blastocatellia bacterium]
MSERSARHVEAGKSSKDQTTLSALRETLKHPVFLLMLGSALTYLVVPVVTSEVNRRQALRELRLKKASEIGANHTEFNSKFNVLRAVLETFHDNQVDAKPTREEFKAAQKELVKEFNARRFELAEKEWWWYRDLQRETTINKLVPPEMMDEFNRYIDQYKKNVSDSHDAIKELWTVLKSPEYVAGDKAAEGHIKEITTTMAQNVDRLEIERTGIIEGMSRFFVVQ